jgi:hypothetical protein
MKGNRTYRRSIVAMVGIVLGLMLPMRMARADFTIIPPTQTIYGLTYGQWSAKWWQWALSIPSPINPILDPTGTYAGVGQSNPVWFLAGTFGGSAERWVTVPPESALFFPILNTVWVTVRYLGDPPFAVRGAEQAARDAIAVHPDTDILQLEIDGRRVRNLTSYRVRSPVFTSFLPDDNLFGIRSGNYPDCVADGYWIMLAPLSTGQHTIHFRGENASGFVTEVTYHVTVP